MKKVFFATAMLIIAMAVNGQWTNNVDTIYTEKDYVGIGTSSPDALLDVAGFKFGGSTENYYGPDNVFVVGGHSSVIPKSDFVHNKIWSDKGAFWASPMIYRSMRYPDNGTGSFPFNQYGELILQGTSHGSNLEHGLYNMGISFITWDGTTNDPGIKMRIKENGNVGIGTTSPLEKLHLEGGLLLGNTSQNNSGTIRWTGTDFEGNKNGSWSSLTGESLWQQNGSNLYFDSGSIGIGTDNPECLLDLETNATSGMERNLLRIHNLASGFTSYAGLKLMTGDAEGYSVIQDYGINYNASPAYDFAGFLNVANSARGVMLHANSAEGVIKMFTGYNPDAGAGYERLRIDANGRVGIGTTKPSSKLQISNGDIYISDIDKGIIMKSPDGTCWRGTLDNSGQLNFAVVECPGTPPTSTIEAPKKPELTVKNISIYPNPTNESLYIEYLDFEVNQNIKCEVYSMMGQLVKTERFNGRFTKVDVSDLVTGTYILKLSNTNGEVISIEEIIKK